MKKILLLVSLLLLAHLTHAQTGPAQEGNYLDLVWEAHTSVPPHYAGRALPSPGSEIVVSAVVKLGKTDPAELIYTWQKDNYNLPANSGKGKNSLTYRAGTGGTNLITLGVKDEASNATLTGNLSLPIAETKVLVYPSLPLQGPNYAAAIPSKGWRLPENTFSLLAEPYFFSNSDLSAGRVDFSWLINDRAATPSSADGRLMTLQAPNNGSGQAQVNLRVKNQNATQQAAGQNLQIEFGSSGFPFSRLLIPVALAQEEGTKVGGVTLLEPDILGENKTPVDSFSDYLGRLFRQAIGFVGLVAILMLVWKGVQYAINPVPGLKLDAKERIWDIVKGVLLALAAYIILYQINPDLVTLEFILK